MTVRVAYLTSARWRGGFVPEGELPALDAPDFALLKPLAAARGVDLVVRRWDSPTLAEDGFDCALVRSTWDYADRSDEFLAHMEALDRGGLRVLNPPAALRWNARKTYLEELGAKGAPVIPTVWADAADAETVGRAFDAFEAAELVVKPQIGAGSRDTIRLRRNAWNAGDLAFAPKGAVMIQPFLPGIETSGERSLFYFNGRPAHAVRKTPAPGKWYANVDGARFARDDASAADRAAAEQVLALAPRALFYARIDLVDGPDGRPCLIELEAIEPYLFFAFAPEGAGSFANALAAVLLR
jgi:glutathione synthase/RimK-type ligase-like ATP-grasp enzyme